MASNMAEELKQADREQSARLHNLEEDLLAMSQFYYFLHAARDEQDPEGPNHRARAQILATLGVTK